MCNSVIQRIFFHPHLSTADGCQNQNDALRKERATNTTSATWKALAHRTERQKQWACRPQGPQARSGQAKPSQAQALTAGQGLSLGECTAWVRGKGTRRKKAERAKAASLCSQGFLRTLCADGTSTCSESMHLSSPNNTRHTAETHLRVARLLLSTDGLLLPGRMRLGASETRKARPAQAPDGVVSRKERAPTSPGADPNYIRDGAGKVGELTWNFTAGQIAPACFLLLTICSFLFYSALSFASLSLPFAPSLPSMWIQFLRQTRRSCGVPPS